jgi:hypothetical protein
MADSTLCLLALTLVTNDPLCTSPRPFIRGLLAIRRSTIQLRPKDGPVCGSVESGVIVTNREASQRLFALDDALERDSGVWAQPVVVKDDVHCCRLGKLHQLVERLDMGGLGLRQERFHARAPQWTGVFEPQREFCDLCGTGIAHDLGKARWWHMDSRLTRVGQQVVSVILRDESLLVMGTMEGHTGSEHERHLLARLMVLDAQGEGQGQWF